MATQQSVPLVPQVSHLGQPVGLSWRRRSRAEEL